MERSFQWSSGLLLIVTVLVHFGCGTAAAAPAVGPAAERPRTTAVDSADHPNQQPYETERSVLYHVLASPSYVLHGVTRPLGWGVRYLEEHYPGIFEAKLPPRGGLPLLDLGGPTDFLAGGMLYDNQLFGSAHAARVEGLYGGPNTFRSQARYHSPSLFGAGNSFQITANVFSNPRSGFFLGGNDSNRDQNASANRDQVDVTVSLQTQPRAGLKTSVDLLYEHVVTDAGSGDRGERLAQADPPGLGTVDLLTSRLTLETGRTKGGRRPYLGTEAILQVDYTHDLVSDRFRYGRYAVGVRQYLPVGFLPKSRRLVLRGHLEQVEPLFDGTAVPFYQQPGLGGQSRLRGFASNRFRDGGALAGSAEYRYPIWSNLDALLLVDAGQVFETFGDVTADRFHWSYGGGIHLLTASDLGFRFEVVGSPEGIRTILTVNSSFRRSPR